MSSAILDDPKVIYCGKETEKASVTNGTIPIKIMKFRYTMFVSMI